MVGEGHGVRLVGVPRSVWQWVARDAGEGRQWADPEEQDAAWSVQGVREEVHPMGVRPALA